ncbi:MAG: NAD(P)H-binding protein [Pseudomonadota bacterium]
MHLIIGATGRTARAALKSIVQTGDKVRAISRDLSRSGKMISAPNLHWMYGELSDPIFLAQAVKDVDSLYLAVGNSPEQETLELSIVSAAVTAGVRKIVKLSSPTAGPNSSVTIARMHGRIEARIIATGTAYTFLRPFAFMQNIENQIEPLVRSGLFFGSTGDAALNMVDARDVGEVAAVALNDTNLDASSLELTGPEAISYPKLADRLNEMGRFGFKYKDRKPYVYERELKRTGLPDWTIEHIMEIQALTRHTIETPNSNVERILGRPPRSIDAYLVELSGRVSTLRRESLLVERGRDLIPCLLSTQYNRHKRLQSTMEEPTRIG